MRTQSYGPNGEISNGCQVAINYDYIIKATNLLELLLFYLVHGGRRNTMLENYAEHLVREVFNENKVLYRTYRLEVSEEDIIRMVLNRMTPKYFLSTSSEGEKKAYIVNRQMRMEALIKLTEAMERLNEKV